MLFTALVIALNVASVLLESNLREFCSKDYFDSFGDYYITDATYLNRKHNSKDGTYHSWDMDTSDVSFIDQNIQYTLNGRLSFNKTLILK